MSVTPFFSTNIFYHLSIVETNGKHEKISNALFLYLKAIDLHAILPYIPFLIPVSTFLMCKIFTPFPCHPKLTQTASFNGFGGRHTAFNGDLLLFLF